MDGHLKHTLKNQYAANKLFRTIEATVENLKLFPNRHPIIDDSLLRLYEIRYVTVNNYLLFYRSIEETKTIYIIRFLYARSDWKRILHNTISYDEYISENIINYIHEEQEEYIKK